MVSTLHGRMFHLLLVILLILFSTFPFAFVVIVFSETHFLLDKRNSLYDSIIDSPYAIRQPHSLPDILDQLDRIHELSELRTLIKSQQTKIDQRYSEDDPEIEEKLRQTDENCIRSKSMELQTEHFVVSYPVDLMPLYASDGKEKVYKSTETLKLESIKRFFSQWCDTTKIQGDPDCHGKKLPKENGKQESRFLPEPELADITEQEMHRMATFLNSQLHSTCTNEAAHRMATYYASFYWRMRGDLMRAKQCIDVFLENEPDSVPAKFQSAVISLRLAEYPKAIELLRNVNEHHTDCAICLMPLADSLVLNGKFSESIRIFDQAYALEPEIEIALKKSSLLRCTNKIYEVMENQHNNLLQIIKDKETFREKMKRMQELEMLIEESRAPPEARLQAKLAYEHFEFGPLPHANCREGTQWISSSAGGRDRKRLYCSVSGWSKYNEALEAKKKERQAQRKKEAAKTKERWDERQRQRSKLRAEQQREEQKNAREWTAYLAKLSAFVGMASTMDEPQMSTPKYPLQNKPPISSLPFHKSATWPSLEQCRQLHPADQFFDGLALPELFISPEDKGFIVSDFFGKYLAIGPGQLTPLPWKLPNCAGLDESQIEELDEKLRFIPKLEIVKNIKSGVFLSNDSFIEPSIKTIFHQMIGHDSSDPFAEEPMMSEIGQRIGNMHKFGIGPKWVSLNLAALFFRHLGIPAEALKCVESALMQPEQLDIALTQLAQILFRAISFDNKWERGAVERILGVAMQEGVHHPVPYHLMGILHTKHRSWVMAERHFRKALEFDPEFRPAMDELLRHKCAKRMQINLLSAREQFAPLCCWPNEPNIHCFSQKTKQAAHARTRCFRLEAALEEPFRLQFVYFRCNTPYTGRSYPPLAFARLIGPFLRPAAELRALRRQRFIQQLEAEDEAHREAIEKNARKWPDLPLDYGGYSPERIQAHQHPIWPEGVTREDMRQVLDFGEEGEMDGSIEGQISGTLKNGKPHRTTLNARELLHRYDVLNKGLDIPLPEYLPVPPKAMVDRGKRYSSPLRKNTLAETCRHHKEASQRQELEQPVSTWVSVTAKDIKMEHLIDLDSPLPTIARLEPECPEPALALESTSILLELDDLPAYQYRQHLTKFYKPEKALRNTLRAIGKSGYDKIEHVAARLFFAIKAADSVDEVHWALSTLSTLYWRVKGDPVNAIKCLRHSLRNSPNEFKDVPLISLANIYHQAGFLNSALVVGGKALETGLDIVAIHFTLANIYASLGDYPHALQFYHSTLALQANFEPAKLRIEAIHCVTNGELID